MINRGALLVIELFLCTLCRPIHSLVLIRRFTGQCVSSFLAKTRRNARILILLVYSISTPVEITAAVILLTFWDSNVGALPPELYLSTFSHLLFQAHHQGIYTAVICILVCSINIFGVRWAWVLLFVSDCVLTAHLLDILENVSSNPCKGFMRWTLMM